MLAKQGSFYWRAFGLVLVAVVAVVIGNFLVGQASGSSTGLLHLTARANARLARAGNSECATIVVAVNSDIGAQQGLLKRNFLVETQLGSCAVDVADMRSIGHGVYILDIVPRGSVTWVYGSYIMSVYASCPKGTASTVTTLEIGM